MEGLDKNLIVAVYLYWIKRDTAENYVSTRKPQENADATKAYKMRKRQPLHSKKENCRRSNSDPLFLLNLLLMK